MEDYFRNRVSVDDDPDLARNRRANDARLKSRFEHIFEKYEKDFEGIGDEIDLETGEVFVNNGHLENMRHEVDPGQSASAQVLRVFGNSLGNDVLGPQDDRPTEEESFDDWEDGDASSVSGRSGYSSRGAGSDDEEVDHRQDASHAPDELSSNFYPEDFEATVPASKPLVRGLDDRRGLNESQTEDSSNVTSRSGSPGNLLFSLPFLQQSMEAMQSTSQQRGSINPETIQALGQSIANQLARFMTGATRKDNKRRRKDDHGRDSPWEFPTLPGDQHRRTPSPPLPVSSSGASFTASPGGHASIWAPVQHPRPMKRRRSRLNQQTVMEGAPETATDYDGEVDPLHGDLARSNGSDIPNANVNGKMCTNCGETNGRTFRKGPDGLLCNPCGMYYYRYGLLKPLQETLSPPRPEPKPGTFSVLVPEDHRDEQAGRDEFSIPVTPLPGMESSYGANTGRRLTGGDARSAHFSIDEEESIIRLREVDQLPWETIGRLVSNRSAASVQNHYNKLCKTSDCMARHRLVEKGLPVSLPPDERNSRGISLYDQATGQASHQHGRSFMTELQDGLDESGALDTGPACENDQRFTSQENELIVRLREVGGMTWEQISRYLPGRTQAVVQNHYRRKLADQGTREWQENQEVSAITTKTDGPELLRYSKEEDELILQMKEEEGMSFAEMTDYLIGRDEESLHRRYSHLRAGDKRFSHDSSALVGMASERNSTLNSREDTTDGNDNGQRDLHSHLPMPPPPHSGPAILVEAINQREIWTNNSSGVASGAPLQANPVPQTPAGPIYPRSHPLNPAQVGPSAWNTTQPSSKGPLPFQPARKGPRPIQPMPPWPGPRDPFTTRQIPANEIFANKAIKPTPPRRNQSAENVLKAKQRRTVHQAQRTQDAPPVSPNPPGAKSSTDAPSEEDGTVNEVLHTTANKEACASTTESQKVSTNDSDQAETLTLAFTPEQDKFIKKAREKERMSWAEIAARLPSSNQHTSQSVTDRYYDVIVGKAASAKVEADNMKSDPDSKFRQRYTDEESEKVALFKGQGMSWEEMAKHLPGRTPGSVQNHYYGSILGSNKQKRVLPAHIAEKTSRWSVPLLRKALKNSTRGASNDREAPTRPESTLQEIPGRATSEAFRKPLNNMGIWNEQPDSDNPSRQSLQKDAQTNIAYAVGFGAHADEMHVTDDDQLASLERTMQDMQAALDKDDLTASEFVSTPPQDVGTEGDTSASSVPTEPGNVRSRPPPPAPIDRCTPEQDERRSPFPNLGAVYDTPARSSHGAMPYFLGPNQLTLEENHPCSDKENTNVGNAHAAPYYYNTGHDIKNQEPSLEIIATDGTNERFTKTAPDSVKQPKLAQSRGAKGKRWSGRSKRISDSEVADSDSDCSYQETADQTETASEDEEISGEEMQRPKLDWAKVISSALNSRPNKRMSGREILAWVRRNHPFYRDTETRWTHRIRYQLKSNPNFCQVDPAASRSSAWTFAESCENPRSGVDNPSTNPYERFFTPAAPADGTRSGAQRANSLTTRSDPDVEQDPATANTNVSAARLKADVEQPNPHVKSSRLSDSALIMRSPMIATPQRDNDRRTSFVARSVGSKRFEPLPRSSLGGSPMLQSSARRFVMARDVQADEEDDMDELS
ncbi:hypothetical protein WHR41_07182 [Cladosporium halotolerans]|uniref:Uncharacterized protein n=1 Tax=Cladosporium halotolerans TaxID=1052096 RepID=A0AB34KGG3_9PEZI